MPTTIQSVATDANSLFAALTAGLSINLDIPELVLDTDFSVPDTGTLPTVSPLTLAELTTSTVGGTGVFDVLMKAVNAHLTTQFEKNRITGTDYANVYLGAIQAVMQFGTQFLLGRDRAMLENLQLLETIKLAQAQTIRAQADVELVRAQIQMAYFSTVEMRLKAYTAQNQFASSKMELVLGYNGILDSENKNKLTFEQYQTQRAQTRDTLEDGAPVVGVIGDQRSLVGAQILTAKEQYEVTRAQIRETLSTGGAFQGLVAVEKLTKEAQRQLMNEQVDTQRAQTKDTLLDGNPVVGIAAKEKALKDAQSRLVMEQYESQRGQTRGTLSTGESVIGLIGAQTRLYDQQITSYKRDAESKGIKMLLDTWVARKTIDDGVAVPVQIDLAALDTSLTTYRSNLGLAGT